MNFPPARLSTEVLGDERLSKAEHIYIAWHLPVHLLQQKKGSVDMSPQSHWIPRPSLPMQAAIITSNKQKATNIYVQKPDLSKRLLLMNSIYGIKNFMFKA